MSDGAALPGLNQRFSQLVEEIGINRAAEIAGRSTKQIKRYMSGAEIPANVIIALAKHSKDKSVQWLMTGLGIQPNPSGAEPATQGGPKLHVSLKAVPSSWACPQRESEFTRIPVYDVAAAAGDGSVIEHELSNGFIAIDTNWIRRELGAQPENLAIIKARGDSMEPTIRSGDRLLIDKHVGSLVDGTIYVIHINDGLMVKRLRLRMDGHIYLVSDNERIDVATVSRADDLRIIGKVLWVFKTFT